LGPGIDIGCHAFQKRYLVPDRCGIAHCERRVVLCPGTHAVDGSPAPFDPYEIVAEIVELLLDLLLAGLSDGHHANHRRDANGDA
jgi:hypothetical protein